MKKLTFLVMLAIALALALPGGAEAAASSELKKLAASDAQFGSYLGWSVSISGDTAVVGAHNEDTESLNAGAAYVYERNQGGPDSWGEVKKLTAFDAETVDQLGYSVGVSGDHAIVGAYVFRRDQGGVDNWGEVKKLLASDAQAHDQFANVAISGDTAIVGAFGEDSAANDAGAAYIFQRNQGGPDNWGEVKKLTASDAQHDDYLGYGVGVSGDTVIVGSLEEDGESLDELFDAGAAYVFERNQGGPDNWGEVTKLIASDSQARDYFGYRVAISGDDAIVGAFGEDAGGNSAGAAYVFGELPLSVGGIAELPEVAGTALETEGSSGLGAGVVAGILAAITAGALALGGAAWYARRRLRP